jgi:hypothetical protein
MLVHYMQTRDMPVGADISGVITHTLDAYLAGDRSMIQKIGPDVLKFEVKGECEEVLEHKTLSVVETTAVESTEPASEDKGLSALLLHVPSAGSIRGTATCERADDGFCIYDAVELLTTQVGCKRKRGGYARQIWARLARLAPELNTLAWVAPIRRNVKVDTCFEMPVTTALGLQRLLQTLRKDKAQDKVQCDVAASFEKTLGAYLAGDRSMVGRIVDARPSAAQNTTAAQASVRDVLVHATPTRAFRAAVADDPSEALYCVYSFVRAVFQRERRGEVDAHPEHFAQRALQKFLGSRYPYPHEIKRQLSEASIRCGRSSQRRTDTPVVRLAGLRLLWTAFQSQDAVFLGYEIQDGLKPAFALMMRRLESGDFSDMHDVDAAPEKNILGIS